LGRAGIHKIREPGTRGSMNFAFYPVALGKITTLVGVFGIFIGPLFGEVSDMILHSS
jgi:hypothetical protein